MITLKEKSIGPLEQHLGNEEFQITLGNGVKCWSFSSSQHAQTSVKNDCLLDASVAPELDSTKLSY